MTAVAPQDPDAALRHVRNRIADSADAARPVSPIVRRSWERAARAGIPPQTVRAPYDSSIDVDSRLSWAATPVLNAVAADLPDLPVALLLADARSHVIGRWTRTVRNALDLDALGAAPGFRCDEALVGTNSIGLAAHLRAPVVVRGFEHYADALTHVSCASAPVLDAAGELAGVINVTSADASYSPIVTALVGRIAHETEQRLAGDPERRMLASLTVSERRVAEHVVAGHTNRETASALCVSPHTVDYHLRQIFRKLDLRSRVDLVRVLNASAASVSAADC